MLIPSMRYINTSYSHWVSTQGNKETLTASVATDVEANEYRRDFGVLLARCSFWHLPASGQNQLQ